MGVFKAYDIRGLYGKELAEPLAERIGRAFARFLGKRTLVVGRDLRVSSPSLAEAAIRGILSTGTDVVDIGLATTPMVSFAVGRYGYDGGLMTTASHNPGEYNGFKLCREDAIALSEDTGLREIERGAREDAAAPGGTGGGDGAGGRAGRLERRDIRNDYLEHLLSFARDIRPLRVAIDAANGMAATVLPLLLPRLPLQVFPLFFEPDGRFPGHEPNPLRDENIAALAEAVRRNRADLGVAFDGDADRAVFLDEAGRRATCDLVTALVAREVLAREKGAAIVYDLRSSWAVREEIERHGGTAVRERVGHSFIKATMRARNAPFGGELSGHYYFRDHFFADSGLVAFVKVLNLAGAEGRPFSEVLAPLRRYHATGELNFHVVDKDAKLEEVARVFAAGRRDALDGLTVEFDDWWFNLRKSNTEPLLRLNLEARTGERLVEAKGRVLALLGAPEGGEAPAGTTTALSRGSRPPGPDRPGPQGH
ncbi:MAG: phosphomannomutase/phosphoglucomutase [Planctomycetes bacterium]|nr:phosphomannomutase/phosphoglucomutase [Planctomycetota bacterium]